MEKITGIESARLLERNIPDYFDIAWQERKSVSSQANISISDDLLAVAVNSQYGRSQDQLHIHIACLKPEISQQLNQVSSEITAGWAKLSTELIGHHYLAKKLQKSLPNSIMHLISSMNTL